MLDDQARFMRALERAGKLDRALEGLPDDETIGDRHTAHVGLTRPELAVLMAYSKINLYAELLASDLPDDPLLVEDLVLYFPAQLRKRFRAAMERHRLRREIVATVLTNSFLNRMRPASYWLLTEESGKPASDVARAFTIIRESFDLRTIWSDIEALDNKLPARVQTEMMVEVMRLVERAVKWLLRSGYETLDIAASVKEMQPCIAQLWEHLDDVLPAPVLAMVKARQGELEQDGLPERLAYRVASLGVMAAALDIVRLARGRRVEDVASVYFGLGTRFGLEKLRNAGSTIAAETPWQKAAVAAVIDDLYQYQSTLASKVIADANGARDPVESWLAPRLRVVERVDQLMNDVRSAQSVDLAMLTVASRQLRALVES